MGASREHGFARVLVPLDGSSLAEAALDVVVGLGKGLGSTITLLHVLERRPPASIHGERHLSEASEAGEYLGSVSERLREAGLAVELHVHEAREGDVARSIIEHAEEYKQDLVALSSHGRGGIRDVLFGSIAQQVMQRGILPILLVRPDATQPVEYAPRTILVPVDGEHDQEPSLSAAASMARAFEASVHLLWVVPTPRTMEGNDAGTAVLLPTTMRALLDMQEEAAEAALRSMSDSFAATGVAVETQVARGDAVRCVAMQASRLRPDLVVLAGHGRGGLGALLEGSFTQRLAARVRCPLLLVQAE